MNINLNSITMMNRLTSNLNNEAEDRNMQHSAQEQYQSMAPNNAFATSMQLSSMFERVAATRDNQNDDSYVHNSAFAYNEHIRDVRGGFKRNRSFSHSQDGNDCDDIMSFEDAGSFINDEDGFDQVQQQMQSYDQLEIDDELSNLVADFGPFDKNTTTTFEEDQDKTSNFNR